MELYKPQLNLLMSQMSELTSLVCDRLNEYRNAECVMYLLPVISRQEESLMSAKDSLYRDIENIPVSNLRFDAAHGALVNAISTQVFYAQDDQSTKITPKFPGYIILPEDKVLTATMDELNNIKREFGNILAQRAKLTNKREHFEWVHSIFPMLITLMARRELKYFDKPLRSVNFHWKRDTNNTVMAKAELVQTLEDALKVHLTKSTDRDLTNKQFVSDIDSIRRSSFTHFRIRRKKPPAPAASFYFEDGTRSFSNVSSPIFLFGQSGVKISDLPCFERDAKHRALTSFKAGPLILEKLDVYGVLNNE